MRKDPWMPIVRKKVKMQKSEKLRVKASPIPENTMSDKEKIKALRLPKESAIRPIRSSTNDACVDSSVERGPTHQKNKIKKKIKKSY